MEDNIQSGFTYAGFTKLVVSYVCVYSLLTIHWGVPGHAPLYDVDPIQLMLGQCLMFNMLPVGFDTGYGCKYCQHYNHVAKPGWMSLWSNQSETRPWIINMFMSHTFYGVVSHYARILNNTQVNVTPFLLQDNLFDVKW